MNEKLSVSLKLINDKVLFEGRARDIKPIVMDYHPPVGDDLGYTGLEVLMISLAGCSATAIVPVLRKMKTTVNGFFVAVNGIRKDTHPTVLTEINLKFTLTSPDAVRENVEKAIKLAEETYCPVWAMLKGNTVITSEFEIING